MTDSFSNIDLKRLMQDSQMDQEQEGVKRLASLSGKQKPRKDRGVRTKHWVPTFVDDHAEVPVSQGRIALVSLSDLPVVERFTWTLARRVNTDYAYTTYRDDDGVKQYVLMHRLILQVPNDRLVDHRNGDGLDNRRENIRPATESQNRINRRDPRIKPGRRGVGLLPHGAYSATIQFENTSHYLGLYRTEEEAAKAYDQAARELHGDFAVLNFPEAA